MNNEVDMKRKARHLKSRVRLLIAVTAMISLSGVALAQTALGGSELTLPATAALTADMVLLKTENTGRAGSFSIAVSNTGPVEVTGAVVTDEDGSGGLCPKGNPVTISGGGVPEGSFTIANLSGSGIALGTLQPGQSATLTYSCQGK